MPRFKITPSLYTANTLELKKEVGALIAAGIDQVHFDVMDGQFVPNYGFGSKQFTDLKEAFPNIKIDVHLMANDIEPILAQFKGADYLTFHFHSQQRHRIEKLIEVIKQHGHKVGLALDLNDPINAITPYLNKVDLVTLMSIKPGFTGQTFAEETWLKIKELKTFITAHELSVQIQVDGGVRWTNLKQIIDLGVDLIVVGSLMFQANDYRQVMQKINQLSE